MRPWTKALRWHGIVAMLVSPLGIVVLYAILGGIWIIGSDHLLEIFFDHPAAITRYQTVKGIGYVLVTAGLLYLGILASQWRLRQTAVALARAETDQRTLLSEASDAIFVVDEAGRVTLANRQASELLGRASETVIGQPLDRLLAPVNPARVQAATTIMAEHGASIEEHTITRPDGSTVQAEFHFSRLSDGRIQAIARDITGRRRLEAQLRHAQKMEVIGRMAGGVAHDFNNLLTIILGSAANARAEVPVGSDLARDLDAISEAGQRGAEITRQLLSFSRKTPLDPRPVDLSDTVATLAPMARRLAGRNVDIAIEAAPRVPPVEVDPGLFEQAILNLVANARDATPAGGLITIRTTVVVANGHPDQVVVSVSDTGTGMDPTTLERIFEPFFTTKADGRGTGLGLPMVQEFAARSGGRVEVDTALGQGTTIAVRLPASGGGR